MKRYHIRQYSLVWWMMVSFPVFFTVAFVGLMNSWEMGLL